MKDEQDASRPAHPQLTLFSIFWGLLLSVVMGAANVYLGLRVGMTVSASIPAAVVAMAILSGAFRRNSILEANMVQTAASAGESLAAGIIFTMPALVIVGIWRHFDYWTTTLIALAGGLLGTLLMIPMRKVFIVDSPELQFPEGVACAEVLKAGSGPKENTPGGTGAGLVFSGLAVGASFKVLESLLGIFNAKAEWATRSGGRIFFFGAEIAPALVAVGMIVGLPIAVQVFVGGAISWLIAIPLVSGGLAGPDGGPPPPVEGAYALWKSDIRFLGVGAMVVGGLASIWRVRAGLVVAVRELTTHYAPRADSQDTPETERNMSSRTILALTVFLVLLIGSVYYRLLDSAPVAIIVTAIMLAMAFFFTGVASYIVGLVGSSNSPVSGMTITAILFTAGMIYLLNAAGIIEVAANEAILATLGVAGIVCCVACTAGDCCNDLKTGLLVGASPRQQQWLQIFGVAVAAFVMAPIMSVLHEGSLRQGLGGIGVDQNLPAPQSVLMASMVGGFFRNERLAWNMVIWGAAIGAGLLCGDFLLSRRKSAFRLHVMPVAVGMYLPFGLATTMLLGGFLHWALSRNKTAERDRTAARRRSDNGTLVASGVIAGESLVGVLLGILAFYGVESLKLAQRWNFKSAAGGSVAAILLVAPWMYVESAKRRKLNGNAEDGEQPG
jgi:putative OPT family oligopeptide transporter